MLDELKLFTKVAPDGIESLIVVPIMVTGELLNTLNVTLACLETGAPTVFVKLNAGVPE